jgi:molybdopterin synthase sulfur carrier subunit
MAILRHPGWPAVSVTVRFFAGAQAAAGVGEEKLTLIEPATVGTLIEELSDRYGADLVKVLAASSFIVDEVAASPERVLSDGAQVDVLPPFAGG